MIFAISFSSWSTYYSKNLLWIFLKMVDIVTRRFQLYFDKKLAKSFERFLRYSMIFLGNLQKPVFRVFDPRKVRFFLWNFFEELRFWIIFQTSGRRAHGKHFSPSYLVFCISRLLIKSMRFVTWPRRNFFGKKFLVEKIFFFQFFHIFA